MKQNLPRRCQAALVVITLLVAMQASAADDPDAFIAALKLERIQTKGGILYLAPQFADHRELVIDGCERFAGDIAEADRINETNARRLPRTIELINQTLGFEASNEQARKQSNLLQRFSRAARLRLESPDKMRFFVVHSRVTKDYLRAGGTIPMVKYDAASDTATFEISTGTGSEAADPDAFVAPPLDRLVMAYTEIDVDAWRASPLTVGQVRLPLFAIAIHEVVEVTVMHFMIKRKDGLDFRWFSDGCAHAATLHVLRELNDKEEIASFERSVDVKQFEDLRGEICLEHWLMNPLGIDGAFGVSINPVETEGRITLARYAYAHLEISRLMEKHGAQGLQKVLANLGARESVTPRDYLAAIKEALGEDLAPRLREYQPFATLDEGLALYSKRFAEARKKEDHEAALLALCRLLELRSKQAHQSEMYPVAAQLYRRMGKPEAGAAVMRTQHKYITENFPGRAEPFSHVFIDYAYDCGDLTMVDEIIEPFLKTNPHDAPALLARADRLRRSGELEAARAAAKEMRQFPHWQPKHRAVLDKIFAEEK